MPRRFVHWDWWNRHRVAVAFVVITVVYVVTLLWIQEGRLQSCRRTYSGIREVFQPFLTPPPKPSDGKRYRDYITFNNRVDELRANCDNQIRPWLP